MWLAAGGSSDEGGSTCSKEAGCMPLICICISRPVRMQFHLECRITFCSRSLCPHFYLFHSQSFLGGCYLLFCLCVCFFLGVISPLHILSYGHFQLVKWQLPCTYILVLCYMPWLSFYTWIFFQVRDIFVSEQLLVSESLRLLVMQCCSSIRCFLACRWAS